MIKKERPILFNTEMIKALNLNLKTETRRTRGLEYINDNPKVWEVETVGIDKKTDKLCVIFKHKNLAISKKILCPCGLGGDRLWVRETVSKMPSGRAFLYKDGAQLDDSCEYMLPPTEEMVDNTYWDLVKGSKWIPSIHMPKIASRLKIELDEICIEKLQDITHEGCRNEGIEREWDGEHDWYKCYSSKTGQMTSDAKLSYQSLWGEINGIKEWNRNPFVWVLKFKVIQIYNG
ncbi:MAG TPA: hypothetical protein VN922_19430 [Bacteroidia bacterium]|nr:hypothetical protein [Bacteroidia bacterium]